MFVVCQPPPHIKKTSPRIWTNHRNDQIEFQNRGNPRFRGTISCLVHIFCLYTLLKAVSYSELSVLSMSVMGFQKNWMGVGGCGELYPSLFWIFGFFLTLQSP